MKIRLSMVSAIVVIAVMFVPLADADVDDFLGPWIITIHIPDAEPLVALLEIEQHDGEWLAWIENGPAPVNINGNRFEITVDSHDRQANRFDRYANVLTRITVCGVRRKIAVWRGLI